MYGRLRFDAEECRLFMYSENYRYVHVHGFGSHRYIISAFVMPIFSQMSLQKVCYGGCTHFERFQKFLILLCRICVKLQAESGRTFIL
jgi:hypothetical protein